MNRLLKILLTIIKNPKKIIFKLELYLVNFFINRTIPVILNNKKIFEIAHFGKITKMRADSFQYKEPETIEWIDRFQENENLLDIGANIGIYSLYAAYKKIKVLAIEPDALNFSLLNLNIKNNSFDRNVVAYPYSINNISKISKLNITSYSWGGAMSSFDRELDWRGNKLKTSFVQGSPGISIDEIVAETKFFPNHIKIDVDGNELLIIKGAKETLSNLNLKTLLIELYEDHKEYQETIEIIEKNNFILSEKRHSHIYDNDNLRTDNHIFVRTN